MAIVAEPLRKRTVDRERVQVNRSPGSSLPICLTGTTSGFGKRLVSLVLSRGDYVIAAARGVSKFDIPLPEADRTRLHLVQMDLTDTPEKIQSAVVDVLAAWGRIDVLINNAAWAPKSLLEEARWVWCRCIHDRDDKLNSVINYSPSYSQAVFQTNVFGVLNLTNAVLPQMRARRTGTVVFLGSRSVWKADTIVSRLSWHEK